MTMIAKHYLHHTVRMCRITITLGIIGLIAATIALAFCCLGMAASHFHPFAIIAALILMATRAIFTLMRDATSRCRHAHAELAKHDAPPPRVHFPRHNFTISE